ncbi:MAG: peptidylprolyl isomerase [Balneolales bacterium]|nr:peptidylprolyl isomerase [Balneolales bacterium]
MNENGILKTLLITSIVFISCTGSNNSTQNTTPPPSDAVGIVGNDYVTYTELMENYMSGNLNGTFTLQDLQEFLPIYLDYRAKLLQAEDNGYFNNESINSELEIYTKQAAYAYWMDKEIRPTKFDEFKEKYSSELKSSHVLVSVGFSANPEDTLAAYNTISEARERFLSGSTMQELDQEFSSKRDGRSMGGDLPWVSTGRLVAPFEEALFKLEVGEISMPVRTQFGYHLIYLEDKRERIPARRVNHIFVRRGQNQSNIDSAYSALERGDSWNQVVSEYSEDRPSVPNNGNIGWVDYTSNYNQAFVDTLMKMDPSLPYTGPIESTYGWHIFNIEEVRIFETEAEEREFLLDEMNNANVIRESNSFIVNYLKQKYESVPEKEVFDSIATYITRLDTTSFNDIEVPASLESQVLYTFNNKKYTGTDYFSYLKETRADQLNYNHRQDWFERYQESVVDSELSDLTLAEFPEFQEQIDSYKNGIVIYQINEDSVWSSSTIDSTFLMERYEANVENYQFMDRSYYYMVTSRQDTTLENAKNFVLEGNSPDSLLSNGFNVGVNSDSTGAFQGEPFDLLQDMEVGTFSQTFEYGQRRGIFYLVEKLPARTMTFDEAFNRIVSDYIPEREQNWLNRLRNIYEVEAFPEVLESKYMLEQSSE